MLKTNGQNLLPRDRKSNDSLTAVHDAAVKETITTGNI